jgi:hypothetical protein
MQRSELLHVLRASAAITQESSFVLIGSQAILLLLEEPPEQLLRSTEIDLYPAVHPEKTDLIDGAHDLTVSKCAAGRQKDADFVRILLQEKHIALDQLLARIAQLDKQRYDVDLISKWAQRRAQEAGIA